MTATAPTADADREPRPYGHSVLASACARWWRGGAVISVTLLVNAILQSVLVLGDPTPGIDSGAILLAIISMALLLMTGSVVVSTALSVSAGRVSFSAAFKKAQQHFGLYCAWTVIWFLVVGAVAELWVLGGLVLTAITPFVIIAAADGHRNAIGANFRAIGNRFGRYLLTMILTGIMLFVAHLLSVANEFFITGAPAALVYWLVYGIFMSWVVVAWSLLFRATKVGAAPAPVSQ